MPSFTFEHGTSFPFFCVGGNQRELARQKNAKKQKDVAKSKASSEKGGNKGVNLEARKHR